MLQHENTYNTLRCIDDAMNTNYKAYTKANNDFKVNINLSAALSEAFSESAPTILSGRLLQHSIVSTKKEYLKAF